jgi:hypothetical protein
MWWFCYVKYFTREQRIKFLEIYPDVESRSLLVIFYVLGQNQSSLNPFSEKDLLIVLEELVELWHYDFTKHDCIGFCFYNKMYSFDIIKYFVDCGLEFKPEHASYTLMLGENILNLMIGQGFDPDILASKLLSNLRTEHEFIFNKLLFFAKMDFDLTGHFIDVNFNTNFIQQNLHHNIADFHSHYMKQDHVSDVDMEHPYWADLCDFVTENFFGTMTCGNWYTWVKFFDQDQLIKLKEIVHDISKYEYKIVYHVITFDNAKAITQLDKFVDVWGFDYGKYDYLAVCFLYKICFYPLIKYFVDHGAIFNLGHFETILSMDEQIINSIIDQGFEPGNLIPHMLKSIKENYKHIFTCLHFVSKLGVNLTNHILSNDSDLPELEPADYTLIEAVD